MRIEIENLKGISSLAFDIPKQGLWLLTGLNGTGKTSLLAAMYRIKYSRAFQDYYKTTATQSKLDTFKDSKVTYKIGESQVTYQYSGKRWPPRPRRNSSILTQFPFPNIQFIEANSSRVEPFSDEITPKRTKNASQDIREFMSHVLGDTKWNDLKYVNTRRGVGNQAFLLPYKSGSKKETYYYSEKNFSLGELCTLRLAEKLSKAKRNSLILVDEIEMALHPQAQIRLLRKLNDITSDESLTVIFSTHSSTLIKNINRKQIILLSENNGDIDVKRDVFPARVLGEIAFDEELNTDFIFLVEDEQAKILLEQLCGKYLENNARHNPMFKVVPIGGYHQVLQLLDRSVQIFPEYVKRFAFLDDDVRVEAIPNARKNNTTEIIDLYERLKNKVNFLPCTPELGLVNFLEKKIKLNLEFAGTSMTLCSHLTSSAYTEINCDSPRKSAKIKLDSIIEHIRNKSGYDETSILRTLYRHYIDDRYSNISELMSSLGPVFNSR